jgi:CheY-like chemotaxis protein/HPt (histidine-containing phosphotransfer) domain-containing protein
VNQRVAIRILEKAGHSVRAVTNGFEVLAALQTEDFHVVLMDVQMPGLDGLETTGHIRDTEGPLRHTPIIAMTAHALQGDRERCLAAGMDDYIAKPIQPVALLRLVDRWVAGGAVEVEPEAPRKAEETLWDPERLKALSGNDLTFEADLIRLFLEDARSRIGSLTGSDMTALDLKPVAHSMRGSASNFGAVNLGAIAEKAERRAAAGEAGPEDCEELRKAFEAVEQSLLLHLTTLVR